MLLEHDCRQYEKIGLLGYVKVMTAGTKCDNTYQSENEMDLLG